MAQPCLSGYRFRRAVEINCPVEGQSGIVYFEFRASDWISGGKLRNNCADIRFVSSENTQLRYWIDTKNDKSNNQGVWVELPSMPLNKSLIYMFHGNVSAVSQADTAIFELFDHFDNGLDTDTWNVFGTPATYTSGSTLTIGSNTSLVTDKQVARNYTTYAFINSIRSTGGGVTATLGQSATADQGFGMSYDFDNLFFELNELSDADPFLPLDINVDNSLTTGYRGMWSFSWRSTDKKASAILPENGILETKVDSTKGIFPGLHSHLSVKGNGEMDVDWIALCKFNDKLFEATLSSTEDELSTGDIAITGTNVFCVGDSEAQLILSATQIDGATYTWLQNKTILVESSTESIYDGGTIQLSQNGTYEVHVDVGGFPDCATQIASIDVVVDPELDIGSISGSIDTCELINSGTIQLSSYSGTPDYWEYRELPGSIWNTLNHKLDYYEYSGLQNSYQFRAHLDAGACGAGYTDTATVHISPTSDGGILYDDSFVCYESADTVFVQSFTGNITQWESRVPGGTWSPISLTNDTLAIASLTDSTWFRVQVQSGNCPAAYSNTVLKAVSPKTDSGRVTGGKYVCYQNNLKDTLRLTGYTGSVMKWESSITSEGPWGSVDNPSDIFIYQGLVNTTYFRALVESPGCDAKYSQIDTVIVESRPEGGILSGSATVCATENSGQLKLSGYNGKILKWIVSADSANSWASVDHLFDTLSYSNLQKQRQYRVILNTENETCANDTSTFATINVSPATEPGSLFTPTTRFCAGQNIGAINIINKQGNVRFWESSSNGQPPWTNINLQEDSLVFENLESTTFYRAYVQSGTCPVLKTDSVRIGIDQLSVGGNILGSKEVCEAVNEGTLTLVNSFGSIAWQSSIDTVTWKTVDDNVSEYAFAGLDTTTWYRTILKSGVCKEDTSTFTKITVHPLPDVALSADDVNLNNPTVFVNSTTVAEGSVQSWFWDFGDDESSVSKTPKHTYANPGSYLVKLNATSNKGCLDSASAIVNVLDLPDVAFEAGNACLHIPTVFNNTSAVMSTNTYYWNFGDGSTETLNDNASFTYTYANAGTYTVTLRAVSNSGGEDYVSHDVVVYPRATVDFDFDNVCTGSEVQFTNRTQPTSLSMAFAWDFGNGETESRTDPSTQYSEPGNYMVTLEATTVDGCVNDLSKPLTVYPLPVADFTVEDVPYQQESVFLNASSIDNGSLSYEWLLGDGNSTDTIDPVYVYESPGVYTVRLTATSNQFCSHFIEKDVKIFALPVAKFTFDNVCIGDSVYFSNESTIPSGTQHFEWMFGDKRTSQDDNPVHLYEYPGIYTVRMISISDKNARDTVFHDVEVYDLPGISFSFNEACDGFITHFENGSNVSDGNIASVLWDFGDGSNSVQLNPDNLYLNPGIYPVNLEVISSTGCKNNLTDQVIVHRNPVADFTAIYVCLGKETSFDNLTTMDYTDRPYTLTYQWDMGDSQSSTARDPQHDYDIAGIYPVSLKVSTDAGCVDSLKRNVEVFDLPAANAGPDTTVTKGFPIKLLASGGIYYEWLPEEGLSDVSIPDPTARPMETTLYSLRVTDENNCISYDSLLITVEDEMRIIPSNILTPNNNNENDTWNIVNIDSYPEAEIMIFDRWGKTIYKTSHYLNDWQGTNFNGDILPDGTYYYVIVLSKENNMIYKGAITILRDK